MLKFIALINRLNEGLGLIITVVAGVIGGAWTYYLYQEKNEEVQATAVANFSLKLSDVNLYCSATDEGLKLLARNVSNIQESHGDKELVLLFPNMAAGDNEKCKADDKGCRVVDSGCEAENKIDAVKKLQLGRIKRCATAYSELNGAYLIAKISLQQPLFSGGSEWSSRWKEMEGSMKALEKDGIAGGQNNNIDKVLSAWYNILEFKGYGRLSSSNVK